MKTLEKIKQLQKIYSLEAKISFGQNFLVDDEAIEAIINEVYSHSPSTIAEIGCGLGSLTSEMVSRGTEVIGYELDKDMIRVLEGEIKADNFILIPGDFLVADLGYLESKKAMIVGNLPYNITKKLILKVVLYKSPFDFAFMVQKEVAEKLFYRQGSTLNNPLSAYLALSGVLKEIYRLPPSSFLPSPKVHSCFLFYKGQSSSEKLYRSLSKLFLSNNKTLLSNLKYLSSTEKAEVLKIIEKPTLRAHELSIVQLQSLIDLDLF